jgi:hypothetical protein
MQSIHLSHNEIFVFVNLFDELSCGRFASILLIDGIVAHLYTLDSRYQLLVLTLKLFLSLHVILSIINDEIDQERQGLSEREVL